MVAEAAAYHVAAAPAEPVLGECRVEELELGVEVVGCHPRELGGVDPGCDHRLCPVVGPDTTDVMGGWMVSGGGWWMVDGGWMGGWVVVVVVVVVVGI